VAIVDKLKKAECGLGCSLQRSSSFDRPVHEPLDGSAQATLPPWQSMRRCDRLRDSVVAIDG